MVKADCVLPRHPSSRVSKNGHHFQRANVRLYIREFVGLPEPTGEFLASLGDLGERPSVMTFFGFAILADVNLWLAALDSGRWVGDQQLALDRVLEQVAHMI